MVLVSVDEPEVVAPEVASRLQLVRAIAAVRARAEQKASGDKTDFFIAGE